MTNDKARFILSIIMVADQVEDEETLEGRDFIDAVVQYGAGMQVTREEVVEVLDTKLRELICRD
jgi:hypothetical protein